MAVYLDCQRCTACCRWPGEVRVSDQEITRLAEFTKMTEFEFIQQFAELAANRRGLVLKNQPTGECIFLRGRDCSVQIVKPTQCREFPNTWNFPGFEQICHAVRREVSAEEYAVLTGGTNGGANA